MQHNITSYAKHVGLIAMSFLGNTNCKYKSDFLENMCYIYEIYQTIHYTNALDYLMFWENIFNLFDSLFTPYYSRCARLGTSQHPIECLNLLIVSPETFSHEMLLHSFQILYSFSSKH